MKTPVYITSIASVSPLGIHPEEIWEQYKDPNHLISRHTFNGAEEYAAFLPKKLKVAIEAVRDSNAHFKNLDESVLYAVFSSREAVKGANGVAEKP